MKEDLSQRGKAWWRIVAACQALPVCLLVFLAGFQGASAQENPPADIVADNLNRVAATADQILEVLNKDAGLMVEFKRLVAQDAGASGQILEESDLSDSAITERLREELRARVLATRLVQRYGYLLPKLNPDSELAAERNLQLRARAQELERAPESHEGVHAAPQTVITVGTPPSAERVVTRAPLATVDGARNNSRSEMVTTPPEVHVDLVKTSTRESEPTEIVEHTGSALPDDTMVSVPDLAYSPRRPAAGGAPAAEFEPVRMDRRPNPYADVPSLYDLYVQANSPDRKIERFGLEVFRNGAANPDILQIGRAHV